jgi:NAD+ synthase
MEERMGHLKNSITQWIADYARDAGMTSLVVGISGGIDSSVVSALCAHTGLRTIAVSMPIRQRPELHDLSMRHGRWLEQNFTNAEHRTIDLTGTFDDFHRTMTLHGFTSDLGLANTRSRLRMVCLYQIAQSSQGLVVGTGNRVEDFGVGFYTKYGDCGVDISPIGDLVKTEVWALGKELGVLEDIVAAPPTDGLWDDGRTDQDQLGGLSYERLERAMKIDETGAMPANDQEGMDLYQYRKIRSRSLHKMTPIPVFKKGDHGLV